MDIEERARKTISRIFEGIDKWNHVPNKQPSLHRSGAGKELNDEQ